MVLLFPWRPDCCLKRTLSPSSTHQDIGTNHQSGAREWSIEMLPPNHPPTKYTKIHILHYIKNKVYIKFIIKMHIAVVIQVSPIIYYNIRVKLKQLICFNITIKYLSFLVKLIFCVFRKVASWPSGQDASRAAPCPGTNPARSHSRPHPTNDFQNYQMPREGISVLSKM